MKALPVAILLGFVLIACDAPGDGPKAARGYARAEPVADALEQFRSQRGRYPDSLPELVPTFLPQKSLDVPSAEQEHYPLEYRHDSGEFVLTFRYVGPGMNRCSFGSTDRKWRCSGYY